MNTLLKKIIQTCSVPGNAVDLRDLLINELRKYGQIYDTKWTSFYCAHKNNHKKKKRKIVVTAHMDSPGFIVKNVEDDGKLTIISLGGLNPTLMDVRSVTLRTTNKTYEGIITLNEKEETDRRMATYSGFFGFSSQKDAQKKGVRIGDSVCFNTPIVEMPNKFIAAPHLDNRLGIFLLVDIAKQLRNEDLDCNVYFAATDCEEMGGRGAKILANMIEPDIAICLDATYEEGNVQMGKGPVLTLADASVLLPTTVRDTVEEIAVKSKIPLQFEVYNYAGTDAKDFKDIGNGCLTLCLLIATLNNHSPHEVCSLKDIEYTKKLVCSIIRSELAVQEFDMPYGQEEPYQENKASDVGGRYKIIEKIGRGGMGTVYRVHDKLLSRDIALKVLSDDQFAKEERLRFQREAATIAKLRHEHIIRLYDCGEYNGYPYFTMDLIEGENLFEISKKKKRGLPAKYVAEIMTKVADAVHYANEQGIIHRDLKPDNIMIDPTGKPVVMDFGLAKVQHAETKLTCDGTMLGTLIYIAPEYVSGKVKEVDAQNDVYAIGVILYEMLTRYNPFHGRTHTDTMDKILFGKVPKPSKKNSRIPKSLENICLKAMERSKKNRYANAYELKKDLEAFLRGKKIVYKSSSLPSISSIKEQFQNPKIIMMTLITTIFIIITITFILLLVYARQWFSP